MLSPRYPEPVFTPACTDFSVYFQSFSVVVTDEVLKTFPSHLFSDDFFPPPCLMVWLRGCCATGCQNKRLQLEIRNEIPIVCPSLLSLNQFILPLCSSKTLIVKMWSPSDSSRSEGSKLCSFTASAGNFLFPCSVFWEFWGRQAMDVDSASSCTSCPPLTALKGSMALTVGLASIN